MKMKLREQRQNYVSRYRKLMEKIELDGKEILMRYLEIGKVMQAKANKETSRPYEVVNDLTEALRVAPHNRDLHRVILRIKDEINAGEEKTSSSESSDDAATRCREESSAIATHNLCQPLKV